MKFVVLGLHDMFLGWGVNLSFLTVVDGDEL